MAQKRSRNGTLIEILRHGMDLVMMRGFQAAGLNDILHAAGVPKGSFYHYFRSKEDFGLHLIDYYAGFLFARLEDALGDESKAPLARLRMFFRESGQDMAEEGFAGGSLVGNLAQEMAGQSPAFREKLASVYETLGAQIRGGLEEAASRGEIHAHLARRDVADFIINSWEGAVLRAKAEGSAGPLELFEEYVFGGLLGLTDTGRAGTMKA